MRRIILQKPDYRNDGKYQFITGYTGGGAEECVHLTKEQISERASSILGDGRLEDDGSNLYWVKSKGVK